MKNKALTFTGIGVAVSVLLGVAAVAVPTLCGVPSVPNLAVGIVHLTVVGLLLCVFGVEIVSVFKIDDSTYHTMLIAGGAVVFYFFSADTALFFESANAPLSPLLFGYVSECAYLFVALACCGYVMYLYGLKMRAKWCYAIFIPAVLLFAGYAAALPFGYGYPFGFALILLFSLAFCTIVFKAEKTHKIAFTTYITALMFCLVSGAQAVNALCFSGATSLLPGVTFAYLTASLSLYLLVYLTFTIRSDSKAVKSAEYRSRAEMFESRALSGQIKPHFLFNALEAVRALYHEDLAAGDAGVKHLSDFLRDSVRAFDSELVPVEEELDAVFSYTEFENLKRDKKVDVLFNIEYTGYSVPPLSVQPFVENAIKYSGVEATGGCVVVSSLRDGDFAVLEISDNGKGFDPATVSPSSHGIRNASDRLLLTLGAKTEVLSRPDAGCRVKILIPLPPKGDLT